MKKALYSSILVVILAVICLFSYACSCVGDEKKDYLTVYSDNATLSAETSFLGKKTINLYDEESQPSYFDESALQKRTEIIFGNDIELQYRYTKKRSGYLVDAYISSDEHYRVQYQRITDKMVVCIQDSTEQIKVEELECIKEEVIKTAADFVKSKWKVYQDDNFSTSFFKQNDRIAGISFVRRVNGFATDESVLVYFSSQGEITGWNDFLRYPDGIPQAMQDEIADLDLDLCKKSVAQYVSECAKESSKKKIEIEKDSEWFKILFGDKGRLAVRICAKLSSEGKQYSEGFIIIIPYEGQPVVESGEINQEQNFLESRESYSVTDKDDETSDLPETEAPVVEPLDTPEILCSDTIPAEE